MQVANTILSVFVCSPTRMVIFTWKRSCHRGRCHRSSKYRRPNRPTPRQGKTPWAESEGWRDRNCELVKLWKSGLYHTVDVNLQNPKKCYLFRSKYFDSNTFSGPSPQRGGIGGTVYSSPARKKEKIILFFGEKKNSRHNLLPQSSPCSAECGSPEKYKYYWITWFVPKTSRSRPRVRFCPGLTKNSISSSVNFGFGVPLNLREIRFIKLGLFSFSIFDPFFFYYDLVTSLSSFYR